MPTYKFGDMWSAYDDADLFLITANSYVRNDGALVMGRGIARQVRDRFPGIDLAFGRQVEHLGTYNVIVSNEWPWNPAKKVALFQVKHHFRHNAERALIVESTWALAKIAEAYDGMQFHLNFPGIGNGGLPVSMVKPLLYRLPDNVFVWRFAQEVHDES